MTGHDRSQKITGTLIGTLIGTDVPDTGTVTGHFYLKIIKIHIPGHGPGIGTETGSGTVTGFEEIERFFFCEQFFLPNLGTRITKIAFKNY